MEVVTGMMLGEVGRAGEDAVVRLPKEFGFLPGMTITFEKNGTALTIRPRVTPEEALLNNRALADELTALWTDAGGPPPPEVRDPDIFPDRPGLY